MHKYLCKRLILFAFYEGKIWSAKVLPRLVSEEGQLIYIHVHTYIYIIRNNSICMYIIMIQ